MFKLGPNTNRLLFYTFLRGSFILTFCVLPVIQSFSQNDIYSSKVFNIYRRDAIVLQEYANKYLIANSNKLFVTNIKDGSFVPNDYRKPRLIKVNEGYLISGVLWKAKDDNKCYIDLYVYGDIVIKGRDNRVKVEIRNLYYVFSDGKSNCEKKGKVEVFLTCKGCPATRWKFEDDTKRLLGSIEKTFKDYVASFEDDEDIW